MLEIKPNSYETDVACNLCGSLDHKVVSSENEEKAKFRDKMGVRFVECSSCRLRFYSPRMTEEYAVASFIGGGEGESEAVSMIEKGVFFGDPQGSPEEQIAILKSYYTSIFESISTAYIENSGRPPHSMFEVGCSVGWFAASARDFAQARWGAFDVAGCDANPWAASFATQRNGIPAKSGTFSSYPVSEQELGHYDILVGYDFIEHTYTPLEDLRKLHGMAAPTAILALKTFVEEFDGAGAMIHPLYHHYHFSRETLRAIVEKAGWRIVKFDDTTEAVYAQVTVLATKA